MKKMVQLIIGALVLGLLFLGLSKWYSAEDNQKTGKKIYVYNWGEYIDPDLIKKFEKETGIKVVYETFDSNEDKRVYGSEDEKGSLIITFKSSQVAEYEKFG